MNKKTIEQFCMNCEQNEVTLDNLKRSIQFAIQSHKGLSHQYRIMHASFKRASDIIENRNKSLLKAMKKYSY